MKIIFSRRVLPITMAFLFCLTGVYGQATAETNGTPKFDDASQASISETMRSYLQLQEQLHATQQALERNREETERLAARNAEAVSAKLKAIEDAMDRQRNAEQENVRNTNKLMLIFAASFAVIGFIAMLATAYLQWRAVNRLAEITALLPAPGHGNLVVPAPVDQQLLGAGVTEETSMKMFGVLNRLEQRILELEHSTRPPVADKPAATNGSTVVDAEGLTIDQPDHTTLLLAKGESLLNLDKAAEALACYDEILAEHPDHPEALVKKGVVLEQLRQNDDALQCYDRAIAADGSLTVAYLQKGGLFNRLERYEEALQCYEQALRSQEKARAA